MVVSSWDCRDLEKLQPCQQDGDRENVHLAHHGEGKEGQSLRRQQTSRKHRERLFQLNEPSIDAGIFSWRFGNCGEDNSVEQYRSQVSMKCRGWS